MITGIIPLSENPDRRIVAEKLEIALQGADVREYVRIMAEVYGVVPDVEMFRLRSPTVDVLKKLLRPFVAALADRHGEIDAAGAQARHHVVPEFRFLRRLAGIFVGESLDDLAGELLLHRLGDGVYEPHHRSRRRLFLRVHRAAFFTFAVVAVVVLAHSVAELPRIAADARKDIRCHKLKHVGVGKAELSGLVDPFAFLLAVAEIFRMRREIFLGRQEPFKCVADAEPAAEAERSAAVLRP